MFLAEEAGIFVPSETQAGKAGMKLKNDGISHETLRWSPPVIAHAPAAWRGYPIAEFETPFPETDALKSLGRIRAVLF